MEGVYSDIRRITVERFRMARYIVISPNAEVDAAAYMERWAENCGLSAHPGYVPKRIGWAFLSVSKEQRETFGLRGYVAAYVIPEDFEPACGGVEIAYQERDDYAVIAIADPYAAPSKRIAGGYERLFDYAREHGLEVSDWRNRMFFEEIYAQDGRPYMDIYLPIDIPNREDGGRKAVQDPDIAR